MVCAVLGAANYFGTQLMLLLNRVRLRPLTADRQDARGQSCIAIVSITSTSIGKVLHRRVKER